MDDEEGRTGREVEGGGVPEGVDGQDEIDAGGDILKCEAGGVDLDGLNDAHDGGGQEEDEGDGSVDGGWEERAAQGRESEQGEHAKQERTQRAPELVGQVAGLPVDDASEGQEEQRCVEADDERVTQPLAYDDLVAAQGLGNDQDQGARINLVGDHTNGKEDGQDAAQHKDDPHGGQG